MKMVVKVVDYTGFRFPSNNPAANVGLRNKQTVSLSVPDWSCANLLFFKLVACGN